MIKNIILILFLVIIMGVGYLLYKPQPVQEISEAEANCLNSGGKVTLASCCKSTGDFPNLCLIGSCGCSPESSSQVKTCDCGEGRCFDGKECAIIEIEQPMASAYCLSNDCSKQEVPLSDGSLPQKCYRDLNECLSHTGSGEIILCTLEQRNVGACFQIYDPVCAKVNVQCIKAPCYPVYQTFSNPCEACKNPLVESYTKRECMEVE